MQISLWDYLFFDQILRKLIRKILWIELDICKFKSGKFETILKFAPASDLKF